MDSIVKNLIEQLPDSPISLSHRNKKKINQYLPVPTDFEILWADILSFGGYPAGVVLTNRGIVFKAPKSVVKEENSRRKEANKAIDKKEEKKQALKSIYQIIPWEYYDATAYKAEKHLLDNGEVLYSLSVNGTELTRFGSPNLYKFFVEYANEEAKIRQLAEELSEAATFAGLETIDLENTAYHAAYGADQTKTGHGNYAEDAGVILDRLSGHEATGTGRDTDDNGRYFKDGPDKRVDGTPIQCKYCKTPGSSVQSCFRKDPQTGQPVFRYKTLDGKPMQIEVPKDQYEKAVQLLEKRIEKGQVPGVTDKSEAAKIIRKGKLTYKQACNLAKAGTFESIAYDAVTGVVSCTAMCGISALTSFGIVYWQTKDVKKAAKAALLTGVEVFGPAFASRILAAQIARTGLSHALIPATDALSKMLSPQTVQKIVNAFRSLAGKKAIYGAAAQKSFAKALRTTAMTQGIMFVVFSVPDTIRVVGHKMSGAQYTKNMTSMVASFLGAAAGSYGAGIAMGKVLEEAGEKVKGQVGGAVGFAAGIVGGTGANMIVRGIGNLFHEDDAIITTRLFNACLSNMCIDYMLSETEVDEVIKQLDDKGKAIGKLQRQLIASERQYYDVEQFLDPIFKNVVSKREKISNEIEARMLLAMDDVIAEAIEPCEEEPEE